MRLLLDHEYHRVDPDIVWRTVDNDLPALALALRVEAPSQESVPHGFSERAS
jgi:uncharacterized protein with HEPN domain